MSVVTAALGALPSTAIVEKVGAAATRTTALTALAVGVDIACGLGIAADSPLSFFRPATAGLIGAAAAVARIEDAPMVPDFFRNALGPRLQPVRRHDAGACRRLDRAARSRSPTPPAPPSSPSIWPRRGFTGPHDVFEGVVRLFPKLFDRGDLSRYTATLGQIWRIGEISTKPYPSGRASHGVLGVAPIASTARPQSITAHVPPLVHRLVGRPMHPDMTPAHARLCLPFLAALMLTDGQIDPRRFTPEAFADPGLAAIAVRVRIEVDDNPDPNALSPQRLVIDGGTIDIPHTLGSPAAPLSLEQGDAKVALARELAGDIADPRLFDGPLAYFTDPR